MAAIIVSIRNVGSLLTARLASAFTSVTAAGTGDATAINGTSFDRQSLNLPRSCVFTTLFSATLAATKTLSLTTVIQHSDDGSTWAAYQSEAATVVATGPTGGGTVSGQHSIAVALGSAKRYVRAVVTPDLSASGTDTATVVESAVFGGENPLPAVA